MDVRLTDLLRQMIATPSLSHKEDEVVAVISSALHSMDIEHIVRNGNIIASNKHYSPSKKTLALDAHVDTVPASSSYTRDPYDPGNDPDTIYGLGSNDDGGSVISMIAAFAHYYDKDIPINLMLTLTCEEECSGTNGARWLYAADGYFNTSGEYSMPDWVIVGEPTGMKVATSERGLLVLDGIAEGKSGHAAREEGVNALYIALDDILKLRGHKFAKHSPVMGDVKLNVTQIQAGSAHNVIPDRCSFVVDIRPTEQYTNEDILYELQSECRSKLKARNLMNRSSATAPNSPLATAARILGLETFSSPTTSDWMRIGCDAIKMGPGDSSRSHKADEYILTEELDRAAETYIEFISTFYGNTME